MSNFKTRQPDLKLIYKSVNGINLPMWVYFPDENIKNVKDIMKLKNEKIDELYPNSENEIRIALDDYESRCFLAMLFFENVFNYWCGKYTKIIYDSKNNHNISAFDHLSMELLNWVRDEMLTEQLKRAALNFKKAVM